MTNEASPVTDAPVVEYLSLGGLFNPELMDHGKVRDMVIRLHDSVVALRSGLIAAQAEANHLRATVEVIKALQSERVQLARDYDAAIGELSAVRNNLPPSTLKTNKCLAVAAAMCYGPELGMERDSANARSEELAGLLREARPLISVEDNAAAYELRDRIDTALLSKVTP